MGKAKWSRMVSRAMVPVVPIRLACPGPSTIHSCDDSLGCIPGSVPTSTLSAPVACRSKQRSKQGPLITQTISNALREDEHPEAVERTLPPCHIDWDFLRPQIDLVMAASQAEPISVDAADRFALMAWARYMAQRREVLLCKMTLQEGLARDLLTEQYFLTALGKIQDVLRYHVPCRRQTCCFFTPRELRPTSISDVTRRPLCLNLCPHCADQARTATPDA